MTVPTLAEDDLDRLRTLLGEAQRRGFLGPGPVESHLHRALAFAAVRPQPPTTALDLGSGGGLPGLPLAAYWTTTRWVFLDSNRARTSFLREAVEAMNAADRITVLTARAEDAGQGALRGTFDLVAARSFAIPGVTAECGAPFLRVGGQLVVAEPPGGEPSRWPPEGLAAVGLRAGRRLSGDPALQVLECVAPCPDRYPRRVGIPAKRPLF